MKLSFWDIPWIVGGAFGLGMLALYAAGKALPHLQRMGLL